LAIIVKKLLNIFAALPNCQSTGGVSIEMAKPILHSTLEIQPATLFGEKCVRLGYLSISVFTNQNFRIKEKNENLF
jgi:hypothetical protein